jgi:hypothetical protein
MGSSFIVNSEQSQRKIRLVDTGIKAPYEHAWGMKYTPEIRFSHNCKVKHGQMGLLSNYMYMHQWVVHNLDKASI